MTFYEHINYGGASYTTAQALADLRPMGWNDVVSSFKSLSGQRPKWYVDINSSPPTYQWSAGAWVADIGWSANDRFSSVRNIP